MHTRRLALVPFLSLVFVLGAVRLAPADWSSRDPGATDNLYDVTFLDADNGYAVGFGQETGAVILKTTDGGHTWKETRPITGGFLFSVRFTSEKVGYVAGYDPACNCGLILKTRDAGRSWEKTHLPSTFGLYDLEFPTSKLGFVCGYGGKIFRTTNGGKTWKALETGAGNLVFRWMSFADTKTGFALAGTEYSNSRELFRTKDGGRRFERVHDFGADHVITGVHAFENGDLVVCGAKDKKGFVRRSSDGGKSWEEVLPSAGFPLGLVFDGDTGVVVGAHGNVARSSDAGKTWSTLKAPFGEMALAVTSNDGSFTLVGADGLVYRYEDSDP